MLLYIECIQKNVYFDVISMSWDGNIQKLVLVEPGNSWCLNVEIVDGIVNALDLFSYLTQTRLFELDVKYCDTLMVMIDDMYTSVKITKVLRNSNVAYGFVVNNHHIGVKIREKDGKYICDIQETEVTGQSVSTTVDSDLSLLMNMNIYEIEMYVSCISDYNKHEYHQTLLISRIWKDKITIEFPEYIGLKPGYYTWRRYYLILLCERILEQYSNFYCIEHIISSLMDSDDVIACNILKEVYDL